MWLPAGREVMPGSVAVPLARTTAGPKATASITNWTEPVGVGSPAVAGRTTAVRVRAWPYVEEARFDVRDVVVTARSTAWPPASVPLLEAKSPVSLVYRAVTVWVPTASPVIAGLVAEPRTRATVGPKATPSMANCTEPVGV